MQSTNRNWKFNGQNGKWGISPQFHRLNFPNGKANNKKLKRVITKSEYGLCKLVSAWLERTFAAGDYLLHFGSQTLGSSQGVLPGSHEQLLRACEYERIER